MRDVLGGNAASFLHSEHLKEGGEKQINSEDYIKLNQNAAETGLIDLLDAELFTGDEAVKKNYRYSSQIWCENCGFQS